MWLCIVQSLRYIWVCSAWYNASIYRLLHCLTCDWIEGYYHYSIGQAVLLYWAFSKKRYLTTAKTQILTIHFPWDRWQWISKMASNRLYLLIRRWTRQGWTMFKFCNVAMSWTSQILRVSMNDDWWYTPVALRSMHVIVYSSVVLHLFDLAVPTKRDR